MLSKDNDKAIKLGATGWNTSVLLTRPSPNADGSLTVTFRRIKGAFYWGWAVPDLDPTDGAARTNGSFVNFSDGELYGLGTKVIEMLPNGEIPDGGTLSLRYDPARGTMHARVNGGAEHPCFTGLRNDLVPAVCFYEQNATCAIVD